MQSPERTAISIRALATNYTRSLTPKLPMRPRDHMWNKPSYGMMEVKVDSTFHADTLLGASGAVVRDDKGDFIAAASWFIPHVRDVDSAELMAIRNGIYLQVLDALKQG